MDRDKKDIQDMSGPQTPYTGSKEELDGSEIKNANPDELTSPEETPTQKIPDQLEGELDEVKEGLENYKDKLLEKFDEYIIGIQLLPSEEKLQQLQEQPEEDISEDIGEELQSEKLNTLVLVDDTDVEEEKMSRQELRQKLEEIIKAMADEVEENIDPQMVLLKDLWQSCYDGKYDLVKAIALGAPVYDSGMLGAIKIAEVHKNMVLQKFEKYVVSYALGGSLVQGKATPTSDIDAYVIVDDTDVKKMSRGELKDKLRRIIVSMAAEAGEITGIKNQLHVQVYILTDFWDKLKEANPVIFTLLRDGIPFYDRGVFMPWKQLLDMGKIKPSREAIDMFMESGSKMLKKAKNKLQSAGMEDTYYSILSPSQAALMLYGLPPPTPDETSDMVREVLVEKEGLLEEEYADILDHNLKVRKDIEHDKKDSLSGEEVDELIDNAEKYLDRIEDLFEEIEEEKKEEDIEDLYERILDLMNDVLESENIIEEEAKEEKIVEKFEEKMVENGEIPKRTLENIKEIIEAKEDSEEDELTKAEVEKAKRGSQSVIKRLVQYIQKKKSRELEQSKIKIKHGERFGEVLLLEEEAYIVKDIENTEERKIIKAPIKEDGSLGNTEDTTEEEMQQAISKSDLPARSFIKEPIFESLRDIFGKDVEILINQ